MIKAHPTTSFSPCYAALFWSIVAFVLSSFVLGAIFLQFYPAVEWLHFSDKPIDITFINVMSQQDLSLPKFPNDINSASAYPIDMILSLGYLIRICLFEQSPMFELHVIVTLISAWHVAKLVFERVRAETPSRIMAEHVSGPEPLRGEAARIYLNNAWAHRRRQDGNGVSLAPGIPMPVPSETEGILLVGRPGSGKSVVLEYLMRQALERGGRIVALDVKGKLDMRLAQSRPHVLGLSGYSFRSVWAIGTDLVTDADADEFAASLIPESRDPVWGEGSRPHHPSVLTCGC